MCFFIIYHLQSPYKATTSPQVDELSSQQQSISYNQYIPLGTYHRSKPTKQPPLHIHYLPILKTFEIIEI